MTEPYFNRDHPKYQCCCGLVHVRTGTKIFCYLLLFANLIYLIGLLSARHKTVNSQIVGTIIGSLLVAGPLVGIRQRQPCYFLPYLCYLGIMMCLYALATFCCIYAYVSKSNDLRALLLSWVDEEGASFSITVLLLCFVLAFFLDVWIFSVVHKCYKYINDKVAAGYNKYVLPVGTTTVTTECR